MNGKSSGSSSVVVLEKDADFPHWVADYQRQATNSVVVSHMGGETLADFEARIERRVAELTEELRVAVISCSRFRRGERFSQDDQGAARERISRMLLARMPARGQCELFLVPSTHTDEDEKHAIFELAGALCDDLRGTSRSVRVRFSFGRPESGILPRLADTQPELLANRAVARRG
ncbi:MAG TPA: hypothetical protein VFQ61_30355 [Polyangiaceae bacterium]|nr:hypothetical protein [Polyangiaceae bacterium]